MWNKIKENCYTLEDTIFSNYLIFINGGLGRVNANCIFQIRAHSALFGRLWVAPAYQTHGRNKSPRKTSWILKGFPKTSIGVKLLKNKRYFINDCGKLQETLNLCAPGSFICVCARWPKFGQISTLKTHCRGLGQRRT